MHHVTEKKNISGTLHENLFGRLTTEGLVAICVLVLCTLPYVP